MTTLEPAALSGFYAAQLLTIPNLYVSEWHPHC